jgi:hypothetical protein
LIFHDRKGLLVIGYKVPITVRAERWGNWRNFFTVYTAEAQRF